MNSITRTQFDFPKQTAVYKGKVRDVYTIDNNYMVMVATDRISAFDVVLPKGIPFKGQVLNQIAAKFLDSTSDIVKNWKIASPDPMVTVGYKCESLPVEMIGFSNFWCSFIPSGIATPQISLAPALYALHELPVR